MDYYPLRPDSLNFVPTHLTVERYRSSTGVELFGFFVFRAGDTDPLLFSIGDSNREFETALKRVSFEITGDGYAIDVEMRRSLADQFDTFWSEFEQSSPGPGTGSDPDVPDRPVPDDRSDDHPHG